MKTTSSATHKPLFDCITLERVAALGEYVAAGQSFVSKFQKLELELSSSDVRG